MNIDQARRHLKSRGIILTEAPGEYRLRYLHGDESAERIAEDLATALNIGHEMAAGDHPLAPEPWHGPLPKKTRGSYIRGKNMQRLKRKEKVRRSKAEAEVSAMLKRISTQEKRVIPPALSFARDKSRFACKHAITIAPFSTTYQSPKGNCRRLMRRASPKTFM